MMRRWTVRRFTFGLKPLFVVTLLCALGCAYVVALRNGARRQLKLAEALQSRRASVTLRPRTDWPAAWLIPARDNRVLTWMRWKSGEPITDADLALLAEARYLRDCELYDCGLQDPDLHFLASVTALERLALGKNPITDDGAGWAARLPHLRSLDVSHTNVQGAFLHDLSCRNVLSLLSLSHTQVRAKQLEALSEFKALRYLYLEGVREIDASTESLADLPLKLAMLNDTDLSDVGLERIARCEKLSELYLDRTSVTPHGLEKVASLRALGVLSLRGLRLTRAVFEAIATLPKLIYLDLTGCTFDDRDLQALCRSKSVSDIFMAHTDMTDAGLQQLLGLSTLELVGAIDTRVTEQAVEQFETKRPECVVSFDESKRRE